MIDWRRNDFDMYELVSACGQYKIKKNQNVYPVEYTSLYLHESVNSEGIAVQSWKRIQKPVNTADEAKEITEQWHQYNKIN